MAAAGNCVRALSRDVGNRETQTTTGGPTPPPGAISYGYDDRDRLETETGVTGGYGYDTNGNLTDKADGATDYAWDRDNRMTTVTLPDGTTVSHAYDADGNRVQTTTTPPGGPATVTNYLVDTSGSLSHVVAETDAAGALTAYYVRGDDLLAVMRPTGPTTWATKYVHADGIGSIRHLTNETGAITDTYAYSAFGERLGPAPTDPQPYAFAGEPLDPNVGFQYHRARWTDPRVGRLISSDPFEADRETPRTLHRYVYAGSNPTNMVDPTGLFESLATLSIGLSMMNTINGISVPNSSATIGAARGRDFTIYLRSFAPWRTFGFGYGGDGRTFSTETTADVTSRINARVSLEGPTNSQRRVDVWSDLSVWGPYTEYGSPDWDVSSDSRGISMDITGGNPLVPYPFRSADIDLHLRASITNVGNQICFSGSLDGDAYPNAELFVVDRSYRATMVHTFQTSGAQQTGPYTDLPGDDRHPMGSFNKCIN